MAHTQNLDRVSIEQNGFKIAWHCTCAVQTAVACDAESNREGEQEDVRATKRWIRARTLMRRDRLTDKHNTRRRQGKHLRIYRSTLPYVLAPVPTVE
jgi:hypothetical protein